MGKESTWRFVKLAIALSNLDRFLSNSTLNSCINAVNSIIWIIFVRKPKELPNKEENVNALTPEVTTAELVVPEILSKAKIEPSRPPESLTIPLMFAEELLFSKVLPFSV